MAILYASWMVQFSSWDMVSRASLQLGHRVSVAFLKDRWRVPGLVVQRSQVNDALLSGCTNEEGWWHYHVSPPLLFWVLEDSMSAPVVKGFSYVGRGWRGKTQQGRAVYKKWLPYENCKSNHPKINIILDLYHMKLIWYNAERKLLMLHPKVRKKPGSKLLSSLFWLR